MTHSDRCQTLQNLNRFCTGDCDCGCHRDHEHDWRTFPEGWSEPMVLCHLCLIHRCETLCPEHDERCNFPRHHVGPHRWDCLLSLGVGKTYYPLGGEAS